MIIAQSENLEGEVEVRRNENNSYTVLVEGIERHPNIDAEGAIRVMAHYLYGTQYKLNKLLAEQKPAVEQPDSQQTFKA